VLLLLVIIDSVLIRHLSKHSGSCGVWDMSVLISGSENIGVNEH